MLYGRLLSSIGYCMLRLRLDREKVIEPLKNALDLYVEITSKHSTFYDLDEG